MTETHDRTSEEGGRLRVPRAAGAVLTGQAAPESVQVPASNRHRRRRFGKEGNEGSEAFGDVLQVERARVEPLDCEGGREGPGG